MTSFLSHAQASELKSRVARTLSVEKPGTHGNQQALLSGKEARTLEVVLDCLSDMHREGKL